MTLQERIDSILGEYRQLVNDTPVLLSLLYDADLLPEQIYTVRGAVSLAAVCEAYKAGMAAGKE